jgi:superfamily II DNA helicase RecQ
MHMQVDIVSMLTLRNPLVICASVERPNLHISFHQKPSEDTSLAARLLCNLIAGEPSPWIQDSTALTSPGEIPSAIVYCVSRSEVSQLAMQMNADERFSGKVRNAMQGCIDATGLAAAHSHGLRQSGTRSSKHA